MFTERFRSKQFYFPAGYFFKQKGKLDKMIECFLTMAEFDQEIHIAPGRNFITDKRTEHAKPRNTQCLQPVLVFIQQAEKGFYCVNGLTHSLN